MSSPVSVATERLHGLDAVRALALLLGVSLHAGMSYMPGSQFFWLVSDTSSSLVMNLAFYATHLFRMTAFFLIAGYFGRLSCERLGSAGFARDRARRIFLTLIAAWPAVMFGITLVLICAALLKGGGQLPSESPPGPSFAPDDFPLAHLWFLYVLCGFYLAALGLRTLLARIDPRSTLAAMGDRALARLLTPWSMPLLGLPVALALSQHPEWYAWFGIPTPDQSLYPNLSAVVGYGLAFAVGWCLQRRRETLIRLASHRHGFLVLAIGLMAACLWMVGLSSPPTPAPQGAGTLLYAWCYGAASWAGTLALVALALHQANSYSAARRYVADASYWIYLAHLPLVMGLQLVASRFHAPWWIEYPLLLALAFALLLGSYHVLVRRTWLGAWLNGKRAGGTAPPRVAPVAA